MHAPEEKNTGENGVYAYTNFSPGVLGTQSIYEFLSRDLYCTFSLAIRTGIRASGAGTNKRAKMRIKFFGEIAYTNFPLGADDMRKQTIATIAPLCGSHMTNL